MVKRMIRMANERDINKIKELLKRVLGE